MKAGPRAARRVAGGGDRSAAGGPDDAGGDRRTGKLTGRGSGAPSSNDQAAGLRQFNRSLPMALLRGHQAVMAEFRPILREHGITEQQWRVLRALDGGEPQRISQLSAATLISGPSLTRILRALEEARLIRRAAEADDQRAARISIQPAGRRLIATVAPRSEERYARIAERYGRRELETLYDMLARLPQALKRRS